ncbi:10132_t:CDS:2 [Paraglomus occultum]|uniref:10132_t:CDS:1 n=1 Tax=Paraglomus occultum TaxID=144539 RepID=A0A9N9CHK1_9GLOM|nr:10132_t:CDS:2 [Paraglomus occultum]
MAFPSFGGFNSSTQSQQPAFGYASTQSSFNFGGGAFGQGAQQPQQPTFGQGGQQGGFGYGQSTAPTFGAGAFGAGSKTQGTGFGFGGLQGQQQAQTQSAFGFGGGFQANTTAAPAFNAFAQTRTAAPTFGFGGFGGFGNTSTKSTTSFTFNQPSQQPQGVFGAQQTQSAFTGFGGAAATTTSAPAFGGGFGGFGGSSTSAGTGLSTGFGGFGGFGATTSTTSAFPSAFGQTTAAAFSFNPSQSGGLASASSGFSFNAPGTGFAGGSAFGNKSVGSGFGQTRATGTFAFGNTGGLGLGGTGRGVGGAQQPQTVYEQLRSIMNSWDPKSPESKFQTYLYNMVHPNEAAQHIPPADRPRKLWDEAQANNPDRTCLVPALMTNFEDLQKRLTHQESAATTCKATIDKLSKEIDGMEEIHNMQTLITLENYKRKYMQLTQRIISLMIKLQLKHLRNTAVSVEEQQLQAEIEKLNHDLKGPNQKVSQLKMQSSILKTQMMPSSGIKQKYEVVDGKEMEALVRVLAEEQTGIAHVIETVQKDSDDVQKMSNELIGEQMGMNMITDTVSR